MQSSSPASTRAGWFCARLAGLSQASPAASLCGSFVHRPACVLGPGPTAHTPRTMGRQGSSDTGDGRREGMWERSLRRALEQGVGGAKMQTSLFSGHSSSRRCRVPGIPTARAPGTRQGFLLTGSCAQGRRRTPGCPTAGLVLGSEPRPGVPRAYPLRVRLRPQMP